MRGCCCSWSGLCSLRACCLRLVRRAPGCRCWWRSWRWGWCSVLTGQAGSSSTTRSSRARSGIIGLALILYEGGLQTSWRRLRRWQCRRRCSAPSVWSSAPAHGGRRPRVVRFLVAGGVLVRRGRVLDRCGGGVRDTPLHAHPAKGRAHLGGRVGRERSNGDRAHARFDRVDRAAGRATGSPIWRCWWFVSSVSARSSGSCSARLSPGCLRGCPARSAGSRRSHHWRWPRFRSVPPMSWGAAASSPSTSSGWPSAARPPATANSSSRSTKGSPFVAQVVMFIVLGLLVFPHELPAVALAGLALAVSARACDPTRWRSGPRQRSATSHGASDSARLGRPARSRPIVLATFVLSSDVSSADKIFNAVFFVVVISTILQGSTLERIAGTLQLLSPAPATARTTTGGRRPQHARACRLRRRSRPRDRRRSRPRSRPPTKRDHRRRRPQRRSFPPRGSTIIEPGDRLFVLAPRSIRQDIEDVFARWRRRV